MGNAASISGAATVLTRGDRRNDAPVMSKDQTRRYMGSAFDANAFDRAADVHNPFSPVKRISYRQYYSLVSRRAGGGQYIAEETSLRRVHTISHARSLEKIHPLAPSQSSQQRSQRREHPAAFTPSKSYQRSLKMRLSRRTSGSKPRR